MTSPNQANEDGAVGTLDGAGAGDNDLPYRFGRRPNATTTFPFSMRQYARLLVLRSRVDAGLVGIDDRHVSVTALAA